jgi:NADH-quinone oxidoreductase subunit D
MFHDAQRAAHCLAIEKLLGVDVPAWAQYIRVMYAEITRSLNHSFCGWVRAFDGAMNILDLFPRA